MLVVVIVGEGREDRDGGGRRSSGEVMVVDAGGVGVETLWNGGDSLVN